MLELIRRPLVDRDDVELHYERFSAPTVVYGARFTVVLARSGQRIKVSADESALTAILLTRRLWNLRGKGLPGRRGALRHPAHCART